MFERFYQQMLSHRRFETHVAMLVLAAVIVDGAALAAGAVGYHYLEGIDWLDAGLDAALVVTGNCPAHPLRTPGGKLFTIFYALVGVNLFVVVIGVLLTPIIHRMLRVFGDRH
jgi:hypothetical protein